MKTSALVLALAGASAPFVAAEDCTADDLKAIASAYSTALDGSCPDLAKMTEGTEYCKSTDCLQFLSDMIEKLPDCSTSGVNVQKSVQAAVTICETGSADTSGIITNSTSNSTSGLKDSAASSSAASKTSDNATGDTSASASATSSATLSSLAVAISSASVAVILFAVL
ncbi:unnamed protein product [Hyaloperonospora brassicae]|uniref:Elicitin-like protein n=1 Tax=Hyaloperonospora brassicae TaxID=162125 RepID=A0AAV0V261_HYABA|nr:unnamed protein product [Hyaloperonospora brassicae]